MHQYLTYCVFFLNVWSSPYRTNLKTICTAQRRSAHPYLTLIWLLSSLLATAQQPHSRDIFINKKNLPLDKQINQQEGMLAYKVINGTYLLNDFLNHGDVRHHIQHRNIGDLRIPLYATAHSQLFVRYRAINTLNGLLGDLRSSSSRCTFKIKLRQLIVSVPNIVSLYKDSIIIHLLLFCSN